MIINDIRKFIKEYCPLVDGAKINVNYLGEKARRYTLEQEPVSYIIKRYTDGGSVRQLVFVFASRELFGEEERENLEISRFYEELAEWFDKTSEDGILPELAEGKTALRLEALTGGYLISNDQRTARYQIQCRLIYRQERI